MIRLGEVEGREEESRKNAEEMEMERKIEACNFHNELPMTRSFIKPESLFLFV